MEDIRLFVSLPFQKDGTERDFPDRIRDFKAPELRRYLRALEEEIVSAAEGLEDCRVRSLEFGTGSFCHIPADDLEELYALIRRHFSLASDLSVTLGATPRGFDFYRLTAARHLNQAMIRFRFPGLDPEQLRERGFCGPEEILAALEVCFQNGYHRFQCALSPQANPEPERLRDCLAQLLPKGPEAILFDAPLTAEQRECVQALLEPVFQAGPEGWYRGGRFPAGEPADQIGCGLGAVTCFDGIRVRASTDFAYYCEHAADFESLVQPI